MSSGMKIFPFYVVIDVSSSMRTSIDAMNEELPSLKTAVEEDPIVGELARFGLITFADRATQILPLSDLAQVEEMPRLSAYGSTSYARAFEMMHGVIPHDLDWFKSVGARPFRPVVFFITDGKPNEGDPWREWRHEVVRPEFPYRPHIVSFGFGDADSSIVRELATFRAYVAEAGANPASVLRTISEALTNSIIASSSSALSGQANLVMPQAINGMYEISLDAV